MRHEASQSVAAAKICSIYRSAGGRGMISTYASCHEPPHGAAAGIGGYIGLPAAGGAGGGGSICLPAGGEWQACLDWSATGGYQPAVVPAACIRWYCQAAVVPAAFIA